MKGIVYSVNIGDKKGEPKKQVEKIILIKNYGVKGDCHAKEGINRQISLLSWERMNEEFFCLKKKGDLRPGIFAENITTSKIDLRKLKIGDRLKINDVIIEISEIGKKCHNWCEIYKKVGKCLMPKEGIFGKVIKGGIIKEKDIIEVIPKIDVGILTISDSCYAGKRVDESGAYLKGKIEEIGWKVHNIIILPDEEDMIKEAILKLSEEVDLILTTGGTGLSERDVTPEATKKVLDKEIPGISEAMRMKTFEKSPNSILSRGASGFRRKTLIINLPGSLKAVKECLEIILPVIEHALQIIKGEKDVH
ncbi:MAG: molybdopterin-binding protein [Candidatus Omnitrophica bacterium]|nr:molybdopterin-binding protein [Candidatus Omnitrophota bacterium]